MRPGGEVQPLHRRRERAPRLARGRAQLAQHAPAELRVRVHARQGSESLPLVAARSVDALPHFGAAFARRGIGQLGRFERVRLDVQVEPVEDGARHATPVSVFGRNPALTARLAFESTRTGIHRRHEHEARRQERRAARPHHGHLAVLERLAQRFERGAPELGQLVHEQDAVVGERNLAGARGRTAADQSRDRRRVVRRAKGPLHEEALPLSQPARHRPHGSGLDRFFERGRRQQSRNALRQHRLARSGRPDQQSAVRSGRGDLQGALAGALAAHFGKIDPRVGGGLRRRRLRGERKLAGHHLRRLEQRMDRVHGQSFDQRTLGPVLVRHQEAFDSNPPGKQGDWEHAPHGEHLTGQRQFSDR